MLQNVWTFSKLTHVADYTGLLPLLGFPLCQNRYSGLCYKPSGLFFCSVTNKIEPW